MTIKHKIGKFLAGLTLFTLLATAGGFAVHAQTGFDQPTVVIGIEDNQFSPAVVSANTGTVVTWVNNGAVNHNVTSSDGSFSSGTLAPGQSFSHTFNSAGSFHYFDSFFGSTSAGMNGVVNVTGEPVPGNSTSTPTSTSTVTSQRTSSSSGTTASANATTQTTQTTAVVSSGLNTSDLISRWIILNGLFGNSIGNGFGLNPISKWIVLSSLFGGSNVNTVVTTPTVDP